MLVVVNVLMGIIHNSTLYTLSGLVTTKIGKLARQGAAMLTRCTDSSLNVLIELGMSHHCVAWQT